MKEFIALIVFGLLIIWGTMFLFFLETEYEIARVLCAMCTLGFFWLILDKPTKKDSMPRFGL